MKWGTFGFRFQAISERVQAPSFLRRQETWVSWCASTFSISVWLTGMTVKWTCLFIFVVCHTVDRLAKCWKRMIWRANLFYGMDQLVKIHPDHCKRAPEGWKKKKKKWPHVRVISCKIPEYLALLTPTVRHVSFLLLYDLHVLSLALKLTVWEPNSATQSLAMGVKCLTLTGIWKYSQLPVSVVNIIASDDFKIA